MFLRHYFFAFQMLVSPCPTTEQGRVCLVTAENTLRVKAYVCFKLFRSVRYIFVHKSILLSIEQRQNEHPFIRLKFSGSH